MFLCNPSFFSSNSISNSWNMLLFLFPPHMRIHAFLKSHISMRSYVIVPYNRKYYAVRTLNQLHSWDSGTIKEPGIAPLKSHVLCTQSQAIPTNLRKPGDLELPFATLPTQLWRAQVLRRQLLLARSSKSQTTGSPASRNIKLFCSTLSGVDQWQTLQGHWTAEKTMQGMSTNEASPAL